jgi:hypothetical protein
MKKLMLGLVAALACSFAVPAFAGDEAAPPAGDAKKEKKGKKGKKEEAPAAPAGGDAAKK